VRNFSYLLKQNKKFIIMKKDKSIRFLAEELLSCELVEIKGGKLVQFQSGCWSSCDNGCSESCRESCRDGGK